jgi:hypothetical protein
MSEKRIVKVYVAGPFRGKTNWDIKQNTRNAEMIALALWRTEFCAVYCPHLNTAEFQDTAPDDVWLKGHLAFLPDCDAVVVVPGWERSSGTKAEIAEAEKLGIPVFYADLCDSDPEYVMLYQDTPRGSGCVGSIGSLARHLKLD